MIAASLTEHAEQRLKERTSLSPDALLHLLDRNQTVSVGVEPFSNRRHRLFFSDPDRAHFVAIQDFATGEVVTILPLDYHENLAWRISDKSLRRAVWITNPSLHEEIYVRRHAPSPGWKADIVGVFFCDRLNVAKFNLGSYRFITVPQDAEEVLGNEVFVEKVLTRIKQRELLLKNLEEVILFHPKSGEIFKIPWSIINDFPLELDGCQ